MIIIRLASLLLSREALFYIWLDNGDGEIIYQNCDLKNSQGNISKTPMILFSHTSSNFVTSKTTALEREFIEI